MRVIRELHKHCWRLPMTYIWRQRHQIYNSGEYGNTKRFTCRRGEGLNQHCVNLFGEILQMFIYVVKVPHSSFKKKVPFILTKNIYWLSRTSSEPFCPCCTANFIRAIRKVSSTKAGHWLRKGGEEGGPLIQRERESLGEGEQWAFITRLRWVNEQQRRKRKRKKMEREE